MEREVEAALEAVIERRARELAADKIDEIEQFTRGLVEDLRGKPIIIAKRSRTSPVEPTGPAPKTRLCSNCGKEGEFNRFARRCKACEQRLIQEPDGKNERRSRKNAPKLSGDVKCKGCSEVIPRAAASQHAWNAHRQAIDSTRLGEHFDEVAA